MPTVSPIMHVPRIGDAIKVNHLFPISYHKQYIIKIILLFFEKHNFPAFLTYTAPFNAKLLQYFTRLQDAYNQNFTIENEDDICINDITTLISFFKSQTNFSPYISFSYISQNTYQVLILFILILFPRSSLDLIEFLQNLVCIYVSAKFFLSMSQLKIRSCKEVA